MIRINLLDARAPRALPPAAPPRRPGARAGALSVVFAIAAVGAHYVWLQQQASRLDRDLAQARSESGRLAQVQGQYQQLQATAQALRQRVTLIDQLAAAPLNPAPLLATVESGANAAPNLWLTQVEGKGSGVVVAGGAGSLGRVADFLTALRASGWFASIELRDSTEPDGGGPDGPYQFNLTAELAAAPPPAAAAAAAPPTAAAGARGEP